MQSWQLVVIFILLLAVVLLIVLLLRMSSQKKSPDAEKLEERLRRIEAQIEAGTRTGAEFNSRFREDVNGTLREGLKTQSEQLLAASRLETDALSAMKDSLVRTLGDSLDRLQTSNETRLEQIQGVVGEKLDKTLNERLDTNFRAVGDQLNRLYKSLGELQALSSGVTDLNKTLSNVKTRGTWGEVQLGRILEQTMTRSQYAVNIPTKKNSDERVEYAVLFPAQDGTGENVYLPIDSKFPSDIYNKIVDASASGSLQELSAATGELRIRILDEARTIRDKYLSPPRTTNYAIMFLPTEGLYAEVLRIDGLTEQCQNLGILVAGPTTITAILNSLQAGFRNVMLSRKSVEVMKLLEAVKTQFVHMDEEVIKTQKKLSEAVTSTDRLHHRAQLIRNRMKKIGEMDAEEAERLLTGEDNFEEETTRDGEHPPEGGSAWH